MVYYSPRQKRNWTPGPTGTTRDPITPTRRPLIIIILTMDLLFFTYSSSGSRIVSIDVLDIDVEVVSPFSPKITPHDKDENTLSLMKHAEVSRRSTYKATPDRISRWLSRAWGETSLAEDMWEDKSCHTDRLR